MKDERRNYEFRSMKYEKRQDAGCWSLDAGKWNGKALEAEAGFLEAPAPLRKFLNPQPSTAKIISIDIHSDLDNKCFFTSGTRGGAV